MKVAIDYDNCYTLDPEAWDEAILSLLVGNNKVFLVTGRPDPVPEQVREKFQTLGIFYTHGQAKRAAMLQNGVAIDVWIDDTPESIVTNLSEELVDGVTRRTDLSMSALRDWYKGTTLPGYVLHDGTINGAVVNHLVKRFVQIETTMVGPNVIYVKDGEVLPASVARLPFLHVFPNSPEVIKQIVDVTAVEALVVARTDLIPGTFALNDLRVLPLLANWPDSDIWKYAERYGLL